MPTRKQELIDKCRLAAIERLKEKSKKHSMPVLGRLRGEIKVKFVSDCIRLDHTETEMTRRIFKFYYDNHPTTPIF